MERFIELRKDDKILKGSKNIELYLSENQEFSWLLDCEIDDMKLEIKDNILYVKSGIFYYGEWKWGVIENCDFRGGIFNGGIFKNGNFKALWKNGVFKGGNFEGKKLAGEFPNEIIKENIENNTMLLFHGGNLDNIKDFSHSSSKSRYEYGPGLYLTTEYSIAQKYSKGNRKLYVVEINKGNDLNKVLISFENVKNFAINNVIKSKQKEFLDKIEKYTREDKIKGNIVNNIIINGSYLSTTKLKELQNFFVENGADYLIVDNAFGWHETMIILFNLNKIKSIRYANKNEFELPKINNLK